MKRPAHSKESHLRQSESLKKFYLSPKGKKLRRKFSKMYEGRPISKEQKDKISKALKGKKKTKPVSDKTRQLMSKINRDRWSSDEAKLKMSVSEWRQLHPYISYDSFRDLMHYVVARDGKCVNRGARKHGKRLDVHHVVPFAHDDAHLSKICDHKSNLVTLCNSCHCSIEPRTGGDKEVWKLFLPTAEKYLKSLGYKKMLLHRYYKAGV